MKYVSTRGQAPTLTFTDALTTGLASDGGLYVPEQWPSVTHEQMLAWRSLDYVALSVEVMALFAGDTISRSELDAMASRAYANFAHPAKAPLVQLDHNQWILELFHGPTLAFKDFALQFLGQLFDHVLLNSGERRVIVGATSGDTGSAAIEAVRGLSQVELFMLHPAGRVSDVQRRQMTTVTDSNIHNIAVDGDFDDCQRLVKAMFNDATFRDEMSLSAVNSINWARVAAQVVYYFHAALSLGAPDRPVSFSVPSGNFGNVFAGVVAKEMGLPIEHFVVGSNANDILTRFFDSGTMEAAEVKPSVTPSMDIQVSSNFERLLFEVTGRDASVVRQWMTEFSDSGLFSVSQAQKESLSTLFSAGRLSDEETRDEMKRLHQESQYLIDPHSAIGTSVARNARVSQTPMVVLATAHPAKFPDAVTAATGVHPELPDRVSHIMTSDEQFDSAPADLAYLQQHIRSTLQV